MNDVLPVWDLMLSTKVQKKHNGKTDSQNSFGEKGLGVSDVEVLGKGKLTLLMFEILKL